MALNNFGVVTNKLFRCQQPKTQSDFDAIKLLGVSTIYKLNQTTEFPVDKETKMFGGSVWSDPNISPYKPDKNNVLKAVAQIFSMTEAHETVLVHCTHGRDRTGAVCAAYQILHMSKTWDLVYADFLSFDVTGLAPIFDMGIIEVLKEIYFDTLGVHPA